MHVLFSRLFFLFFLFSNDVQQIHQRNLMQRLRPWRLLRRWNLQLPSRRRLRRSAPKLPFIGQKLWQRRGIPSTLGSVQLLVTSLIITRFSSIRLPLNLPWRRLKTTILWFSLLTFAPTRRRSRLLSRKCTIFRPRKLTPSSGTRSVFFFCMFYKSTAWGHCSLWRLIEFCKYRSTCYSEQMLKVSICTVLFVYCKSIVMNCTSIYRTRMYTPPLACCSFTSLCKQHETNECWLCSWILQVFLFPGPMEQRRHTWGCHQTMMLWMLPTRLESSKVFAYRLQFMFFVCEAEHSQIFVLLYQILLHFRSLSFRSYSSIIIIVPLPKFCFHTISSYIVLSLFRGVCECFYYGW